VTSQSGASGVVGMRALMAAAPDGHTLAYAPLVPLAFQPHLVRNTGLGPNAVAPVCNVTENILGIMVKADSPWRTLPDMVAAAKQRPLSYGSPGPNSAPFLGVHRVQSAAGGQWTHVPFRGDGASLTEVIAGRLDFAAIVVASGVPMARAGQTRLVAVFSEGRHPVFPDVPTAREQGIDAFQPSYAALWATRGTPEPILDRLHRERIGGRPPGRAVRGLHGQHACLGSSERRDAGHAVEHARRPDPPLVGPGALASRRVEDELHATVDEMVDEVRVALLQLLDDLHRHARLGECAGRAGGGHEVEAEG
jgi:hypothetical protein